MASSGSDDVIASLLQEMGEQQGYDTTAAAAEAPASLETTNENVDETQTIPGVPRRQLPELHGYPQSVFLAGSHSVWNSMVPGGISTKESMAIDASSAEVTSHQHTPSLFPPTNPSVEVIRRRVFEKFRQEAQFMIQQALLGGGSMPQQQQNQQWSRKVPVPAMLEKWHMDAKLVEYLDAMEKMKVKNEATSVDPFPGPIGKRMTTSDILQCRSERRAQGLPIYDPVLLSKQAPPLFRDILSAEVQKAWQQMQQQANKSMKNMQISILPPKFGKRAQRIQNGLYKLVCEAQDSFESQLAQSIAQEAMQNHTRKNNKSYRGAKIKQGDNTTTGMVQVIFAGVSLKLHATYFEKLQRLYDRTVDRRGQQHQSVAAQTILSFEDALFCLLCRYDMIQGAGLQAGVPGSIMDVLLQRFGCRMECFASPLNCRYDQFGSAFPDVDSPFGSRGSFFDWIQNVQKYVTIIKEHNGDCKDNICLQANPPFCEGLIATLGETISTVLSLDTTSTFRPIMFVVFVPAWRDTKCHKLLLDNKHLTKHILLQQGQHWYAEGTRHRRKDSFRVASFDTSILFYQNDAAKQKWDLKSGNALKELQEAFCSDPSQEERIPLQPIKAISKSRLAKVEKQPTKSESVICNIAAQAKTKPKVKTNVIPPTSSTDHAIKKKRRKWAEQGEDKAQMDLLQSLGLAAGAFSASMDGGDDDEGRHQDRPTVDVNPSSKKRKMHASRRKTKQRG